MKKHKNIITTIGAVALLLGVMLVPSINAMMLEGKTEETATITTIVKEDKTTEKTESNGNAPVRQGSIYGYIYTRDSPWSISHPVSFVLVDAGIKRTLSIFGYYKLKNLPLDRSYTITVTARGLKSESETVYLTSEEPNIMIDFELVRSNNGITMQTQIDKHY